MKSAAITDVGRQRKINQDYIFASDEKIGPLPNLYIVADGMGGHKAGDYASRFCVEEFLKEIEESKCRTECSAIVSALSSVNGRLFEISKSNQDFEGMGTTFVALTIEDKTAFICNVGDSRLYRWSGAEGLYQVTRDHSLVEELIENGEIERKDAIFHPKKNVITRAVGVEDKVAADMYEIELEKDEMLLLCSDGLSNMVNDEKIGEFLRNEKFGPEIKAKELVDYANERGGKDNISVVLVQID